MSKPKKFKHLTRYKKIRERGDKVGERLGEYPDKKGKLKDCTVVAVALATGTTYEKAHAALFKAGRVTNQGAKWDVQLRALEELGFQADEWDFMAHVSGYSGWDGHGLKSMTSYHPQRKPEFFEGAEVPKIIYCVTANHAFVIMDGKTEDWSHDKYLRVKMAFSIKPMEAY